MQHYYSLLGVTPGSSIKEIKLAFIKKAKECHPDVCKDDNAEEKFKELREAFNYLSGRTIGTKSNSTSFRKKAQNTAPRDPNSYQKTYDSMYNYDKSYNHKRKSSYLLSNIKRYMTSPSRSRSITATLELTTEELAEGLETIVTYYEKDFPVKFQIKVPAGVSTGYTITLDDTYTEIGKITGKLTITIIEKRFKLE